MADSRNYLFVAALNLCPEYSGYLFSANNDPMNLENSLKILTSTWQLVSRQNLSSETPTCLLLNGKRELVAFGYDAELQWAELVLDEEQDDYYYFDKSKICLYNNKNIRSGMEIVDITEKKQLPAFIVFKSLIQYLVNHLFDLLKRRGTAVHHDEVRWVLIIPENFTDGAKSLIRSSAEAAGIPTDSLIFALEPETISIFCSTFMTRTVMSEHVFKIEMKISQYMVVDLEVFAIVCQSDSQCSKGYYCCEGTKWCCHIGYVCTGTSTCLGAWSIAGIVIGVLVFIGTVAAAVYKKCLRNYI